LRHAARVTVEIATRADIDLEAVRRVARGGEAVRLTPVALERMDRSRAAFLRLIDRPEVVVYGVTSDYGDRASVKLDASERRAMAGRVPEIAISFGTPLPERVTRAIVLARLANLVEGHGAVSSPFAKTVAALLDGDPLPPVPRRGNGGSGEIIALGHLFEPLLRTVPLGEKEAGALMNGAPCAAGLVADAALTAARRAELAEAVLALTVDAFGAPLEAYDAALEELWGDPYEAAALRGLRGLLDPERAGRMDHQAPVSFRVLPRVLGQVRRTAAQSAQAAEVSLRSVSDNPVFVLPDVDNPDGRVLSTGGYHDARAPAALDALAGSAADLATIAQQVLFQLFYPPGGGVMSELRYHLSLSTMVANGLVEDARAAAGHTSSGIGSPGQNDVISPSFLAWDAQDRAGAACDGVLAVLAACAVQTLVADGREPVPPARPLADEVLGVFPVSVLGTSFGPQLQELARRFSDRVHGGAPIPAA
jgi:histidine ammonia-lyase